MISSSCLVCSYSLKCITCKLCTVCRTYIGTLFHVSAPIRSPSCKAADRVTHLGMLVPGDYPDLYGMVAVLPLTKGDNYLLKCLNQSYDGMMCYHLLIV